MLVLAQCQQPGPPVTVVTITANPPSISSGNTSAITVTVTHNNQPAISAVTLTYSVTGDCGALASMEGKTTGAASPTGVPGQSTNTFTGMTFAPTATATVTVTTKDNATASCAIVVTSKPVQMPLSGWTGGTGSAPMVTIVPVVTSIKPYHATYQVDAPPQYKIYRIEIKVDAKSAFHTGHTAVITPGQFNQTSVDMQYAIPLQWDTDTVQIDSDSATLGVSTWDVAVQANGGTGVLHADFNKLPGPK